MTYKPHNRRSFLAGLAALPVVAACAPTPPAIPPRVLYLDRRPGEAIPTPESLDDKMQKAPKVIEITEVVVDPAIAPNQILVFQDRLVIQHVYAVGRAREYPVGLGRAGLEFTGGATIARKAEWPSWRPTDDMIARDPDRYAKYADGVPGGPGNPLGSRALYLYRDGVDTYYRIHGTDAPHTIGSYVSNGCIRLTNDHIEHLYERVMVGATVKVV